MPQLTGVEIKRTVAVATRWLMRHQNVDAERNRRVDRFEVAGLLHEGPLQERVRPRSAPHRDLASPGHRHGRLFINQDLHVRRARMFWGVGAKATRLPAPVMIAPRQNLVRRGRVRQPRTNLLVEPSLLLMRIVPCHERAEAVRADIASNDQEIARRDVRQKSVLVTERDDPHGELATTISSSTQPWKSKARMKDVQNLDVFINNKHADSLNDGLGTVDPSEASRALPKCLQNSGGIRRIAVDCRELTRGNKALGLKLLEPEVTRHQQVRCGRS